MKYVASIVIFLFAVSCNTTTDSAIEVKQNTGSVVNNRSQNPTVYNVTGRQYMFQNSRRTWRTMYAYSYYQWDNVITSTASVEDALHGIVVASNGVLNKIVQKDEYNVTYNVGVFKQEYYVIRNRAFIKVAEREQTGCSNQPSTHVLRPNFEVLEGDELIVIGGGIGATGNRYNYTSIAWEVLNY